MEIGEALRRWRMARDMTQRDVARLIGTSPTFVSGLESGDYRMSAEQIAKLKDHDADIWRFLCELRLAEVKAEMGLNGSEPPASPAGLDLAALVEIRKTLDRLIDEQEN